jgi:hypothetical protein
MSGTVMSQEPQEAELHRRLVAAAVRAEPAWQEESSRSRSGGQEYSFTRWRRGNTLLNVDHYPHQTEHDAAQRAQRLAEASSVGFRPISGYGDEAYLIDTSSSLTVRLILTDELARFRTRVLQARRDV